MADVTMALDFGSSLARCVYSLDLPTAKPELILLEPESIIVPESSIRTYEQVSMGAVSPERSAWIVHRDNYFALGHLARAQFGAVHCLDSLKIDSALQTCLAIVGAIAEKKRLPEEFSIALAILLPWGEYTDRTRFEANISEALSSFQFRRKPLRVTLESFTCFPEGAGLFARGRVPARPGQKLPSPRDVTIAVIMIGYRNVSILFVNHGQLERGETEDFGCGRMIDRLRQITSGQQAYDLVRVVCRSARPNTKSLSTLVRTRVPELREAEIKEIGRAVHDARAEYVSLVTQWLHRTLPNQVDEILISGGTSRYLKGDLARFFRTLPSSPVVNWCDHMDERVRRDFGETVDRHALDSRLTDVYGLFYKIRNRPLPKLRESADEKSSGGQERHAS